jgi:hypothetical protein
MPSQQKRPAVAFLTRPARIANPTRRSRFVTPT